MVKLSDFCKPSEEMDDVARSMRAGEADVDYQKLFRDQAAVKDVVIKAEQEMDASAVSIRLQSERGLSVEAANATAHELFPVCRMPEND